ncbi:7138_t:CDS:2 [Funneliformis geosporum]|uniref:7138_t:CDS:1 n=1 Tax=Funneliformis geosporum TaxID=1117311 RepID=A0A9W4WUP9_9GLOM|nr:7138_t:CDS:2 [Funneliformis geosporum]
MRFFGVLMMGMDNNNILDELVSDLSFQPITINLQKISIVIHSIGVPIADCKRTGGKELM